MKHERTVALRDQGLLLVPSVFIWQKPSAMVDPPWQPTLVYPARGVGLLWEPTQDEPTEALAGLVGRRRAELLEALGAPASTTELAARLEMSPGGVSQHLSALRAAGLVAGRRQGRSVLYARTELAEHLLEGADSVA
jgi:DNA-binding transcriptional ArsR family regulator